MKKAFIRLCSVIMIVGLLAGMMTPFTLFANDSEREFVFRETFSSGSINTSGSSANIDAAKGFALLDAKNCTYTLEKDTLKFTSTTGNGAYADVRFNSAATAADLTQDFILSFWIKPDTDNLTMKRTGWAWYDTNDGGSAKAEKTMFGIEDGNVVFNGVSYSDAHLSAGKWSLIEIAFHYDETATSNSGKTGATTAYTLLFNGEEIASAAAPIKHNNINWFRIFRYANATYEMDDLTVALGSESLIDIPRTGLPGEESTTPVVSDYIYREEFGKGFINTRNMVSAIAGAYGFWLKTDSGSTYNLDGGALNFTSKNKDDFIDLRYYIDGNKKNMARDMTLSFWLNPSTSNFATTLGFGDNSFDKSVVRDSNVLKISSGKLALDGKDTGVAVPANQWTHIEILFDYDATATSSDGKSGAFTSYTIKMNGATVGTVSAHAGQVYHEMNNYRLFSGANVPFSVDDLTISKGHDSLCSLGRSAAPAPVKGDVVYSEDFSDDINTSSDASDIVAANGFYASHTNGTTYNVEGGTLNYTFNMYRDNIRLEFYHEGTEIDLSQDFVLSYKVKSTQNTTYRMYWKDSRFGEDEHSFRHWSNRIRICDDLKTGGVTNPNVFTKPGEWALMELFFHYDENAISETGETGAFTFYSVYVNGEYVQSTKTFYDFHKIDEFTLFDLSEDNFSIDDLTIAYGNVSLGDDKFDDGWDEMDYFVDAEVTTDYDYSICIVGDTQVLSAWKKDSFNGIYDWIVDNYESKKMLAVLGLGDVTSNTTTGEWETAVAAISKLQGLLPYTVIRGNHDGDYNGTDMLNTYFNTEAYKSQFGGFYGENNVDTFWLPLTFGKDKYIVIGLDYGPTDDELAWAEGIIAANPDSKIIITTHSYMDGNGNVLDDRSFGTSTEENTNSGAEIWDKLGRKYANIQMILCGHMEGDYIALRQDTGDNGNVVTQMMINPQWIDDALTNGAGNVTMFYFKEGSNVITVETYSTVEKKHFMAENQFVLDLEKGIVTDGGEEEEDDDLIYRNDFDDANGLNTENTDSAIIAAGGMWNKFVFGSGYNFNSKVFNFIKNVGGDDYLELRYYLEGSNVNMKRDLTISFWMMPTSSNATIRLDFGFGTSTSDIKAFAIVKNKIRINNVIYDDAVLAMNEWSLVEIVAHYDASKGGVYAYTVMLNGEVVDTVDALTKLEQINRLVFFRKSSGTYAIDNLIVYAGNESLINTISSAPTVCAHTFDNVCDDTCNNDCGYVRVPHDYSVFDKNDTQHWLKCSECGLVSESSKANHTYANGRDGVCSAGCGYTKAHVCAAESHTVASAATCMAGGNIEYWTCYCGKFYSDADCKTLVENVNTAIDPANHTGKNTVNYDGQYHWDVCECGVIVSDKIAHTYANGKDGVCTAGCGYTQDHVCAYVEHVDAKPATCIEKGIVEHWICECGAKYLDEACKNAADSVEIAIDADNHVIDVDATEWTAGEQTHYKACTCGVRLEEEAHTGLDCTVCLKKTYGVYKMGDDLYFREWGDKNLTGKFYVTTETGNEIVPEGWYYADESGKFIKEGFFNDKGTLRYVVNGQTVYTQVTKINGKLYMIDWDGKVLTGKFYITADSANGLTTEGWHYTNADGSFIENGFYDDVDCRRYIVNGKTAYTRVTEIDGKFYMIDWDGEVKTGKFYITADSLNGYLNGEGWYYADENGNFYHNAFYTDGNVKRYILNGQAAYTRLTEINGDYYMIEWDGVVVISTDKFYITASSSKGQLKGAGWYKTDADGKIIVE